MHRLQPSYIAHHFPHLVNGLFLGFSWFTYFVHHGVRCLASRSVAHLALSPPNHHWGSLGWWSANQDFGYVSDGSSNPNSERRFYWYWVEIGVGSVIAKRKSAQSRIRPVTATPARKHLTRQPTQSIIHFCLAPCSFTFCLSLFVPPRNRPETASAGLISRVGVYLLPSYADIPVNQPITLNLIHSLTNELEPAMGPIIRIKIRSRRLPTFSSLQSREYLRLHL